ncbi:MAG: response regulator [Chloroflexi bacterium]|nr:response regulator [Chloroflexota bacterium]
MNTRTTPAGHILVVDDNRMNRLMLQRGVEQQGHTVELAESGEAALDKLHNESFDLVLLDLIMPGMDGMDVLTTMKDDPSLSHIPVIVVSSVDEVEGVLRCIELGATDYLTKPFDPLLLRARINASLAMKRAHDLERSYVEQVEQEKTQMDQLLVNILPAAIVEELKERDTSVPQLFDESSVLFADLVGFTTMASDATPVELIDRLNLIFSVFDEASERHGLEKIKTIGDAYMAVAGVPIPDPNHAFAAAEVALDMQNEIDQLNEVMRSPYKVRIGISSGPVIGGIVGMKRFIYDLFGDTVNMASRMESLSAPGKIMVSPSTYAYLQHDYEFIEEQVDVKGKGRMIAYALQGRLS